MTAPVDVFRKAGLPMTARVVPASRVHPNPWNPNVVDDRTRQALRESMEGYGLIDPVTVRKHPERRGHYQVVDGEHRWQVARELGITDIPVIVLDLEDAQAQKLTIILNETRGHADDEKLSALLSELESVLPADEFGLGLRYDEEELTDLLALLDDDGEKGEEDPEPMEPPAEPVTRPGDLIVLGKHRLLCGDSKDRATLDRLYGGAKVHAVLTDPPYGMGLDTDYSRMPSGGSKPTTVQGLRKKTYRPVIGDDEPFDAAPVVAYFSAAREQFWFGGDYYRRTLSDRDGDGSWLVWDKRNADTDRAIGSGFELIWSPQAHKRDPLRYYHCGAFGADARDRQHPTQKPVPLLAEILERWTKSGELIADPFAGSGSTLIAAENLGRRCYALEIDPGYCDVVIDRWERATGEKAEIADAAS